MTRGNLLIVTVLVLALAGMFFWTLNLEQRLAGDGGTATAPTNDGDLENRFFSLERKVERLEEIGRGNQIGLNEVVSDVEKLTASNGSLSQRLAELTGQDVALAANATVDSGVKAAVEQVLKEKAEKEQKERTQRWAEGMARYFLADVEASDEQKKQFVGVVSAYMDERRTVSEKYRDSGEDGREARDADMKRIEEDRNQKLLTIFGASEYQKIEERFNRTRGRMDGGMRGNRGAGGGGPRRR
jgi:hypothetical protein